MTDFDGSIKFDTKIETGDAEKSLEQIERKAKEAYSEVEKAEKKAQTQTEKNTAETEKSTRSRKKNADATKTQTQESEKETKSKKSNTDTTKKQTDETEKNTRKKKENSDSTKKQSEDTDENTRKTKENTESVKDSSEALGKLKTAAAAAGAALVAAGAAALKDAAETGARFSATMSQVGAISGATGADFDALTEKAKEMGAATVFSASQASEAMTYMAMAGWKTADMLDGIEGIMNLAAASGESLAATSDIVTDALTAFGLSAADSGHFADVLAAASSNANTNVGMMGETFKYVAPMAGSLGYSIEDMSVAIGLMANSGIKASMAGTSLNAILTRLATNTSDARTTVEELGVKFYDAEGNARDFGSVMEELREATKNMNAEQKSNLAYTVAGTEASKGFLTILNASTADYDKLTEAIRNADGAAKDMAETMVDNLQGDITLAQSALEGLKLAAFDCIEKPFREATRHATEALDNLTNSAKSGELKESLTDIGESAGELMESLTDFAADTLPTVLSGLSLLIDNLGLLASVTLGVVSAQKSLTIMKGINALYKAANAELIAHMTAQKLDTIATAADCAGLSAKAVIVGVLTGKISLATAAQYLWNTAVKANPIGLIATGIGLVVSALSYFIPKIVSAAKETDEFTKALNRAREEYENVKKQGEDTVRDAEKQAYVVGKLKDRLYELDDALSDTSLSSEEAAEKKQELLGVIDDLKEYIPDLAIEIDNETGRLSTQRSELDRLCESYGKLAIAKAKAEAANDNLVEAYKVQFEAEKKRNEAQTEYQKMSSAQNSRIFWNNPNRLGAVWDYARSAVGGEAAAKANYNKAEKELDKANAEVEYWQSQASAADRETRLWSSRTPQEGAVPTDGQFESRYKECPRCHEWTSRESKICTICGYVFETSSGGNAGGAGGTGSGGTTAKSPYEKTKSDLSYRLDVDEITEEEYYDALSRARDEYLLKDSDEWRKATAEIYKYRKKAAEDEKKTLTEARKNLSDEERKAYAAEAAAARESLDTRLKYGLISEEEYYKDLAALRDKYYDDTDEAYKELTYKLIDYEKEKVSSALSDIASFADGALSAVEGKMKKMREKLSDYSAPIGKDEGGNAALTDPYAALDDLLEYNYYLGTVKDRMKSLDLSDEEIADFFSVLSDMSVEDGTIFARLLSEKSDHAFGTYLSAWKRQNELAGSISDSLYKDEYVSAVEKSAAFVDERLRELAGEIPDAFYEAGENSAEEFSRAFEKSLDALFDSLSERVRSVNSSLFFPTFVPTGAGITNHSETTTVNNNYSYTIQGTDGATPAQIRDTLRAQDELRRLGGIS